MSKQKFLGEFELMVLAALLRLGDDAYGASISEEIESRAGRSVTVGALYATLNRLEGKGFVTTRKGEATAVRGGRAKRYFSITAEGQQQMRRSLEALNNLLHDQPVWPAGQPA